MALSMDEQRMLAEIERRLADDDPVLAARLTTFRLPRLTFATRSARSRLVASLLMLVVVGVVSVFVYALIPFRSQGGTVRLGGGVHSTASPANSALPARNGSNAAITGPPGTFARPAPGVHRPASARSGSSSSANKK
jgi:Protein of unknown function (DUF3040)